MPPNADCTSEHVSKWEAYTKRFDLGQWLVTLVFETLNLQFRGLVDPSHHGRSLFSLRVQIDPGVGSGPQTPGSEKTIGVHDPVGSSRSSTAASLERDDGGKEDRQDVRGRTGQWKYWDGHVGQRPSDHTDAAISAPSTRRRFATGLFR